jgi:hypothetical protein
MAKSSRAQRESEGVVVLRIVTTNNVTGGKGLCFGRARNEGKCQGMADTIGPNHPAEHVFDDNARELLNELGARAKRTTRRYRDADNPLRVDLRGAVSRTAAWLAHAPSRRPSVSRVPEIGTHGLKGVSCPFTDDAFHRVKGQDPPMPDPYRLTGSRALPALRGVRQSEVGDDG